jgi:hypothetical protein
MSDTLIHNNEKNKFYVYGLIDPKTNQPFYIGKGINGRSGFHTYMVKRGKNTENIRKDRKIAKILRAGLEPIIIKYKENLLEDDAYQYETELIEKYGRIGFDINGILTNISPGGAIPNNTGRTRWKKGRTPWNKGKTGVQEYSEYRNNKIRTARTGKPSNGLGSKHSEESKKNRSERMMGHVVSDETCQKMREGNLGKIVSDETRLRQSNAQKNRPVTTDDARQHMKEGQARRKLSPEYNSEETKEMRRLQSLQSWETRRKRIAERNIQCLTF